MTALPAEIRFLLNVIRAGIDGTVPPPPPEPGLDGDRLVAWIRHHRLEPLLAPALAPGNGLAEDVRATLGGLRRDAQLRSMRMAGEAARLAAAFAEARLPLLVVKGAPLSALVYGDPCRRSCRDLDLLVRPQDEAAARVLLARCGYGTTAAAVVCQPNAVMLRHAGGNAPVELHVRLADDDRMLPLAALAPFESMVAVDIAGMTVPTLEINTALVYAAYHGSAHHWSRLYWLADFAAACRHPQVDWHRVAAIGQRAGMRRQLALAAQLSEALLGQALAGLPRPSGRDLRRVQPAFAVATAMLALAPAQDVIGLRHVGVFRVLRADLALHGNWRAAWAQMGARLQPSDRDRAIVSLPAWLSFLYPAIRVLRVVLSALVPGPRRR